MGSEFRQGKPNSLIIADPDPVYRRICRDAAIVALNISSIPGNPGHRDIHVTVSEACDIDTLVELIQLNPETALLMDPLLCPDANLSCIKMVRSKGHKGPIAIFTHDSANRNTIAYLKDGAENVLLKPSQREEISEVILDLTRPRLAERTHKQLPPTSFPNDFAGFIGQSEDMRATYAQIQSIAKSAAPAFITGESGTGKELCAEAIHQLSARSEHPLISLNCSAIPHDLMESEIFGHVKGAFTGAVNDRPGAAELAHGGTLFLDEICEMDPSLQAKLLRFVQTGIIRRVGGSKDINVDIRFVCATNRDPLAEVRAGNFREDLYYRLHVIPVQLSPLRARVEDILPIALSFLNRCAHEENSSFVSFSIEAEELLRAYDWPGNVRQLQNVIRRLVVLNTGDIIDGDMILAILNENGSPRCKPSTKTTSDVHTSNQILPLSIQERRIIEDAVMQCDGNIVEAATALAISPSTIYRKLQSWQCRKPEEKFVFQEHTYLNRRETNAHIQVD